MSEPDDARERFEHLQERLVPLWRSMEAMSDDPQTIVVVPSVSIDLVDGSHVPMQSYEECSPTPPGPISCRSTRRCSPP